MGIQALLSDPIQYLRDVLLTLPAVLPALILHECAHGWVAYKLGDPTAKMLGRLSLDPRKHLDPLGTLSMIFIGLGWAKPVPINPRNFKHYRRDDFLVSIAGITANLIMFLIGCVLMLAMILAAVKMIPANMIRGASFYVELSDGMYVLNMSDVAAYPHAMAEYLIAPYMGSVWGSVYEIVVNFVLINLSLAIFNLIPIPPLDGYHVLNDLILKRPLFVSPQAARIGQLVMIGLLWSGYLGRGLNYVVTWALGGVGGAYAALFRLFGLM
ncbi:MAG: site-2 protease family protein [Clostridia bacterium]|nr:site-2 protease family protein [Clostridia bacterium]